MIAYMLQVIVCSALLYSYYHLFLRNQKFHEYNRFYLLVSVIISILIPLLKIPIYYNNGQEPVYQSLNNISQMVYVTTDRSNEWMNTSNIFYALYLSIAIIYFSLLAVSLYRIYVISLKNPSRKIDNIIFIQTQHPNSPFSFFNYLFWNAAIDTQSVAGTKIMKHEMYHIRNKHSIDNIFMELAVCVYWINPVFYLIRKEIKSIQEFLADQYAADEKNEYANILLNHIFKTYTHSFVNPFFNNQLKRRIMMLTTPKKPTWQYLKKLMALPVIAILIVLFAFSYKENNIAVASTASLKKAYNLFVPDDLSRSGTKDTTPKISKPKVIDNRPRKDCVFVAPPTHPLQKADAGKNISNTNLSFEDNEPIFTKVEKDATYPGGVEAWRNFLMSNLNGKVPVSHKAPPGNYTVIVQFIVKRTGEIYDIKALTHCGYGMEEEAVRVIGLSGKWNPAMQNKRAVIAYRKQPITFQVTKN